MVNHVLKTNFVLFFFRFSFEVVLIEGLLDKMRRKWKYHAPVAKKLHF